MMSSTSQPARYRLKFKKTAGMRFTATLDLQRTLERTLRRAHLSLTYTHGFNPHPRLSLGAALPLGFTSECELADIWLEVEGEPDILLDGLRRAQPPGVEILGIDRVPDEEPSLETQIVAAEYVVELGSPGTGREMEERVNSLLQTSNLPRERRGKPYDLRPLIETLEIEPGGTALRMRLASRTGATGRPDEVLSALGLDPTAAHVHRTRLFLSPTI